MNLNPLARLDGWVSLLKGLGDDARDALAEAHHTPRALLSLPELEALHRHNGIGAVVTERPAQDATRKGWDLESKDLDLEPVQACLRDLKIGKGKRGLRQGLQKVLEHARGFGGGGLVLGIRDGIPAELPVDESGILSVAYTLPVRGDKLRPVEWESNPESELFGAPSLYEFISEENGQIRRVHGSRVHRFPGVDLEHIDSLGAACQGWGDSVHQRLFRELRNVQITEDNGVRTLLETNIPVLSMEGLANLVGQRGGEEQIRTRMSIMAAAKSMLRIMLVSEKDSFEYKAASFAGYKDLLSIYPNRVAAVSGIPLTFLYGTSPGGLNATGESDIRNYYDRVMAFIIMTHVVPAVQRIARLVMLSKHGPTGGVLPESWEVKPNPLYQLSEVEQGELEKLHAEKDVKYVDAGILDRDEVRQSRFGQQGWRATITLNEEQRAKTLAGASSTTDLTPEAALQQGRLALDMLHTPAFAAWAAGLLGAPVPTSEEMDAYWARKGGSAPEEGDSRFDAMGCYQRGLEPLVGRSSTHRLDSADDGTRVWLFFPLPEPLAKQRAPLTEDTSEPHATYLYVGNIQGREEEFLALTRRALSTDDLSPVRFGLGSVESLINRKGQRVHYQLVQGNQLWRLYDARFRLVELLETHGFGVEDVAPSDWLPHLTLNYSDDPDAPWAGTPIHGTWTAKEIQVRGLSQGPVSVTLGPEMVPGRRMDRAPRKYEHISFVPPKAAQKTAQHALDVRAAKPTAQKGLTSSGLQLVRLLAAGDALTPALVRQLDRYFDSHEGDKDGQGWSEKGKTWQAWNGRGGVACRRWSALVVAQMLAADEEVQDG